MKGQEQASRRGHIAACRMRSSSSAIAQATSFLTAGMALFSAVPAIAQERASAGTVTADQAAQGVIADSTIPDIIVTAQKRSESLQKVPVSVAVVQGQALQTRNVASVEDIGQLVPGLRIVNTGATGNSINLRGISSGNSNPAFEQAVASFEDGVYFGRGPMIQSTFLDMDRIEVLKGPQTTYFGNDAIAGALSLVTKRPGSHFEGYARALYGSYGAYALEGAVGGPLSDTFGIRIAGNLNGQRGWITNVNTGELAPHVRNVAGRVTAVWKPAANFEATLKIEGSNNSITNSATNLPYQVANCPPPNEPGLFTAGLNRYCPAYLATPDQPIGFNNNLDAAQPGQFAKLKTDTEQLTLNYDTGGLNFTSITAYSEYSQARQADNSASVYDLQYYAINAKTNLPYPGINPVDAAGGLATQYGTEHYSQFSQELRVASPVGRPIEFMAGAYYQRSVLSADFGSNGRFQMNQALQGFLGFSPATIAQLQAAGLPYGQQLQFTQRENIESAFATVTWNATSKLKLNLGIRGTIDSKDYVGFIAYGYHPTLYGDPIPYALDLQKAVASSGAPGYYPYSRTDHGVMGSAGLQYQFNPATMFYATFSHGWLAGGFNAFVPAPLTSGTTKIIPTFGPETVNSYEAGLKTKLFDNRLVFNLAVFRAEYSQLQVSGTVILTSGNVTTVVNAGSSISQGVELSSQWAITDHLRLTADVTYLDGHYGTFTNAPPNYLQKQNGKSFQDLSGQPLDFAAKWSGSIGAEFTANLADKLHFTADLNPIFTSSYYNSVGTDDPNFIIPSSVRWNGKLTFESSDRRWALDIIGRNLTDKVIIVTYGQSNALGQKEQPRSVAVQLRFKW